MLEPVSDTEMRVHFAVPHGSSACVEFYEDASRSTVRRPTNAHAEGIWQD